MSDENKGLFDTPTAVTPPRVEEPTMPEVPNPEEVAKRKHDQAATVRAGLQRKREAREKLAGKKTEPTTADDGASDTAAKLRAEKDTIIQALRALVDAADNVTRAPMKKEQFELLERARSEAGELLRLIDLVPKT